MAKCGCGTGIEQDCPRCNPVRRSELDQLRTELAKRQEEVETVKLTLEATRKERMFEIKRAETAEADLADKTQDYGELKNRYNDAVDSEDKAEAKLSAVMPVVEAAENVSAYYTEMNKVIDVDVHVNVVELIMEVATLKAYKDKEAGR